MRRLTTLAELGALILMVATVLTTSVAVSKVAGVTSGERVSNATLNIEIAELTFAELEKSGLELKHVTISGGIFAEVYYADQNGEKLSQLLATAFKNDKQASLFPIAKELSTATKVIILPAKLASKFEQDLLDDRKYKRLGQVFSRDGEIFINSDYESISQDPGRITPLCAGILNITGARLNPGVELQQAAEILTGKLTSEVLVGELTDFNFSENTTLLSANKVIVLKEKLQSLGWSAAGSSTRNAKHSWGSVDITSEVYKRQSGVYSYTLQLESFDTAKLTVDCLQTGMLSQATSCTRADINRNTGYYITMQISEALAI